MTRGQRKHARFIRRYHTGNVRPKNPGMFTPYEWTGADPTGPTFEIAAKRAMGLGPTVRYTSRRAASDYHRDKILAACVALTLEPPRRRPVLTLFARMVVDRGGLPTTQGALWEYLAATLAKACHQSQRSGPGRVTRKSFGHKVWYDWEQFGWALAHHGLLTPVRCALIAMRGFHIYRQRNWRRQAQRRGRTFPTSDDPLLRSHINTLDARKIRMRTMKSHLRHARPTDLLRWPWCAFGPPYSTPKKPRPLPDRSLPRTPPS